MGYISSILFGSGKKRDDPDYRKRIAQSGSIVGSILGSNPRSREWNSQKREILEQFEKRERSMRKQWRREDEDTNRELEKVQGRYERRMGAEKGAKYYGEYERDERRRIQREREQALEDLKFEKLDSIRNIQKNIKDWKE